MMMYQGVRMGSNSIYFNNQNLALFSLRYGIIATVPYDLFIVLQNKPSIVDRYLYTPSAYTMIHAKFN